MATDFGVDISAYPDYDPLGTYVTGITALCQRVARRLSNPRGAWFWAPNERTDVRDFLNELLAQEIQSNIKDSIEREVQREEQVLTADAQVSISPLSTLGQSVTVSIVGQLRDGTFKMVLRITAVTVQILQVG